MSNDKWIILVLIVAYIAVLLIGINFSPLENKDGYSRELEMRARKMNGL